MNMILAMVLASLGMDDIRQDAKFAAALERQLDDIKAQTYDIVYPELKARQFIPVNNAVNTGAKTITYRQWDGFGQAQIISNYADDLPVIDALVEEFTSPIKSLGGAYMWSIQDIRSAAMAGSGLTDRRAREARRSVENGIENIAALGNANAGLLGIAKHPNVSVVAATTGDWQNPLTTGEQMVADMTLLTTTVVISNKETFIPDTILLDIASFNAFATRRISSTGDTNTTALQAFLASNPYVSNVASWNKLSKADATNTGPRAICYKRDPEVLTLEIPQEYEELPPQPKGMMFSVPVHARTGGVIVYYPLAMAYMDGLGA